MRVPSTSKLKAFQLAGMTGSIEHAAHLLSISPLAVCARVRSLERELGVRLFHRRKGKLTLTEAAVMYLREVEAIFVSFDIATRDLRARFGQRTRTNRRPGVPGKESDSELRSDRGAAPTSVGRSGPPG
jgi:LysR family transcriptional regulator, glycine cleavage system transcriptional activator